MNKIFEHFKLITKHRWYVFKHCCKAHLFWQGLTHDLSKYSPTEFWESAKFYVGDHSPINEAKKTNGYSKAWLHHKGRNKHHYEYWFDANSPDRTPIIPYKYAVEMVCDKMAAGIVYNGKDWKQDTQIKYYMNEAIKERYKNKKSIYIKRNKNYIKELNELHSKLKQELK